MKKWSKGLDALTKWTVSILFTVIILFLTGISIFGNCYMDNNEFTYFVSDRAWMHMLSITVVLLIGLSYRKFLKGKLFERSKKIIWMVVMGVYLIIVTSIALYLSLEPRADQKHVVETATEMLHGRYTAFAKGGYMDLYPNQTGIVYIFYWLFRIFPFGYKVVILLNVIALLVIFLGMTGIGRVLLKEGQERYATGIMTMLFFPLVCYVTFIYGNLMGMALSTLGLYATLQYLKTRKISWISCAVVASAFAVLIKENYLIPVIGIVIFIVLDFFRTKDKKSIGFLVGLLFLTIGVTSVAQLHTEHITGYKKSSGIPSLAWVEMGMQEGYTGYGWYNEYNKKVYKENDCDTKKAKRQVKKDLVVTVKTFASNPAYALKFFYQKVASEWNNPTFEGVWINNTYRRELEKVEVKPVSKFFTTMINEPGRKGIKEYCNLFQTLTLVGVCMWLLLGRKEVKINQLLPITIFVGGFIFHFFWEAKGQYVMSYFVLLFPYAVRGYQHLLKQLEEFCNKKEETWSVRCKKNRGVIVLMAAFVIILLVSVAGQQYMDKVVGFQNAKYEEFLREGNK